MENVNDLDLNNSIRRQLLESKLEVLYKIQSDIGKNIEIYTTMLDKVAPTQSAEEKKNV